MSDDELTPAEARVRELLRSLAGAPPARPGTALVPHVVRTARWQRAVRGAVQAASGVLGALGDGLSMLIGRRK